MKNYSVIFISLLVITMLTALSRWSSASDTVTLKVYEGYKFASGTITKSGEKGADLSFYVNRGRAGAGSFALGAIGAKKIKEFGDKKPETLSLQEASSWKDYANAPSGGYYGVLGADGKSLYLVKVLSFKNQGKAASFWELTFTWQKI